MSKNTKTSTKLRVLFIITLIAIFVFLSNLFSSLRQPVVSSEGWHYFLKPGATENRFIYDLKKQGRLKSIYIFKLALLLHGNPKLKAGEYFFPPNSDSLDVLKQVLAGDVVYHSFIIVNGWNIYQVMQALLTAPLIDHQLAEKTPAEIAKVMEIPYTTPEGLLFPETYFYTWQTTDLDLLKRAYAAMQKVLTEQWAKRDQIVPYKNAYEALILASMVEKETQVSEEMPWVAEVILKRLAIRMRLQIDSTVIYGLEPKFSGTLTRRDLRAKTPYNSYTQYGLPPTPIAMPSAQAIAAALHPAAVGAVYFVAKGDGSGQHVFSQTLEAHRKAVALYRQALKAKQK